MNRPISINQKPKLMSLALDKIMGRSWKDHRISGRFPVIWSEILNIRSRRIDRTNSDSQLSRFGKKNQNCGEKMKNRIKIEKHNRSCRIRARLIKSLSNQLGTMHSGLITRKWWKVITHFSNQTSRLILTEYSVWVEWTHFHDLALRFGS